MFQTTPHQYIVTTHTLTLRMMRSFIIAAREHISTTLVQHYYNSTNTNTLFCT